MKGAAHHCTLPVVFPLAPPPRTLRPPSLTLCPPGTVATPPRPLGFSLFCRATQLCRSPFNGF
ncbi:hypothetical protein CIPAW_01G049200 [Carya illinoinensis]|uniref:Uncharacterized protein n=1 Tax=Carya illinoinensis TaxID=32201 RepID=A0A8T1RIV2_CARIL|nr:hypothetical protein CIPAW_01G049200 [Carya illinoinensis]